MIKNTIRWCIYNFPFIGLQIWSLIFNGPHWALNIVSFITWIWLILSGFYAISMLLMDTFLSEEDRQKLISQIKNKNFRSVPSWLNTTFDWSVTCIFIGAGHWVLGIAYFIHYVLLEITIFIAKSFIKET